MTFNTAIAGLKAANSDLSIIGNNIANVSTVGFKESRAEFGDVYASSILGSGSNAIGSGVQLSSVTQSFTQGNVSFTDKSLDLAINGNGFFILDNSGAESFTRAGQFTLDKDGFVVNATDKRLQGFSASSSGSISGNLTDLQISVDTLAPSLTTAVEGELNLDARETPPEIRSFDVVSSGTDTQVVTLGATGATANGYGTPTLIFTDANDGSTTTYTGSAANLTSQQIATELNALNITGVTASAASTVNVSGLTNVDANDVTFNGTSLTGTTAAAWATQIDALSNFTATEAAGVLTVTSSNGADMTFDIVSDGATTGTTFTMTGAGGSTGTVAFPTITAVNGDTIDGFANFDIGDQVDIDGNTYTFTVANDVTGLVAFINGLGGTYGATFVGATDFTFDDVNGGGVISIVSDATTTPATFDVAGATVPTPGAQSATIGGVITINVDERFAEVGSIPTGGDGGVFTTTPSVGTVQVSNTFDPTDQDTYNHATSLTVFDSLGNEHVMTTYFIKESQYTTNVGAQNAWTLAIQIDDQDVGDPISPSTTPSVLTYDIRFDSDGTLNAVLSDNPLFVTNWSPINAAGAPNGSLTGDNGSLLVNDPATSSNFEIDFSEITQFGSEFAVNDISQNGFAVGRLAGVEISAGGNIFARFTNGQARLLGVVALANFNNPNGLAPTGNTEWAETFDSGNPVVGTPGTSSLGVIQSGAVEESNADLTEELVDLIIAQRNFQANAKTIQTADTVTQAIINLR